MPKRVSVIDLGSNSARMAIFERTSRLGFYILKEYKTKFRLGAGAYENGGIITQESMQKGLETFREFANYIKLNRVNRVLCVGTSALRDAPNANEFIKLIKNKLGLNLRVIDGKMEAFYGGVGAINLLSPVKEAVTIDIGGGSTELARIVDGVIVDTISLDLGTVRLKELFFDKKDIDGMNDFIKKSINLIPEHFASQNIIAIGGSLRAVSNAIMEMTNHQLRIVHNFVYDYEKHRNFIEKIITSSTLGLKNFPIKKERYDTIREGCAIFRAIATKFGVKNVITSGAGVREGVFLCNILKNGVKISHENYPKVSFPPNFNPSLKSLQDRFDDERFSIFKYASLIFDALLPLHNLPQEMKFELIAASKLHLCGQNLGFYSAHIHSSYFVLNALNYGYTHEQKALIATILKLKGKKISDDDELLPLLPAPKDIAWLSFIYALAKSLCANKNVKFEYEDHTLRISGIKDSVIAKDEIKKLNKPEIFAITFI